MIYNIIIADSSKQVKKLGKFRLPLETIPFATHTIVRELETMGLKPDIRFKNGNEFRTDENNCIIDIDIWNVEDVSRLNTRLLSIPGVVETGLFLNSTDVLIMGKDQRAFTFKKNEVGS